MLKQNAYEIKEIQLEEATIRLRHDGIMHVVYHYGTVLDVDLQMKMLDVFNQLTHGEKVPFLFEAMDSVTITKEARDHSLLIESLSPSLATAVVAANLAHKLMANFYFKFNKPQIPYKVFVSFESAIDWLKTFQTK